MRTASAMALVAGLSVVPTATVMACDCALTELPEAVRDADLAIVGTLVGQSGPAARPGRDLPVELDWTWQVERSRDPIDVDLIIVGAWNDDGANCGVMFGANERWLVLGYLEGGRLLTNGCMRNQRLDGSDPEGEATIAKLLPVEVQSTPGSGGELALPVPLIMAGATALLMGLIGLLAFRRAS